MSPPPSSPASSLEIAVTSFSLEEEQILLLTLAESWLSEDERERAASFRFAVHRERYIRGRGMMRLLLARRLNRDPADLTFITGSHGKPYLKDSDLGFNLSHSEDRALFAVGDTPRIGVDIERVDRQVDHAGLARRCFRPSEIEWMESFAPAERPLAFFRIWTAKEARMKVDGQGFSLAPQKIELSFDESRPVGILEPTLPDLRLESIDLPHRGIGCVVADTPFSLSISHLTPSTSQSMA